MTTKRADPQVAPANPLPNNPFNPDVAAPHGQVVPQRFPNAGLSVAPTAPRPPQPAALPPPTAPPPPNSVVPQRSPNQGIPVAPASNAAPPVHVQDGIYVPPPSQPSSGGAGTPPPAANPGQNADNALAMFAPPAAPPPPAPNPTTTGGPDQSLPPASFSSDPFRPTHSQHTRPTPPTQPLPTPAIDGQQSQQPMSAGGGAGPNAQQAPANKPPTALAPYAQRAAERLTKMPPEAQQQVMQGAAASVSEIMEKRGPAAQQQLQEIMRSGQPPATMLQENAQRLQRQGFDLPAAMQTIQNMGPFEHFLLWGGLGLGAIGLISALSGQGGIGSFLMSALGLGAAAGTAANAGLFGQGAQQTMQGMLGTGGPTPPAPPGGASPAPGGAPSAGSGAQPPGGSPPAAGGQTPTAQGRVQMINQAATTRPETLPALFSQFANELPATQRQKLDYAAQLYARMQRGGVTGRTAGLAYNSLGVEQELAASGITPQAIPAILSAWSQWSPANPPRPAGR